MPSQSPTALFIEKLQTFSGNRLTRPDHLEVLLDAAKASGQTAVLAELGFVAKFLTQSYRIMQRIGREGEGYDALAGEFSVNLAKAKVLLQKLLDVTPPPRRQELWQQYLHMTRESLGNMLALAYDLSWYKNWLIDNDKGAG